MRDLCVIILYLWVIWLLTRFMIEIQDYRYVHTTASTALARARTTESRRRTSEDLLMEPGVDVEGSADVTHSLLQRTGAQHHLPCPILLRSARGTVPGLLHAGVLAEDTRENYPLNQVSRLPHEYKTKTTLSLIETHAHPQSHTPSRAPCVHHATRCSAWSIVRLHRLWARPALRTAARDAGSGTLQCRAPV